MDADVTAVTAPEAPPDAPKSSSSAMPDLTADSVPRLKAQVHRRRAMAELGRVDGWVYGW